VLKVNQSPILVTAETITAVGGYSTTVLSDARAGDGVMDYGIKPIAPGMKVVGTAFTVNIIDGSASGVIRAVAEAGPGYVLVIGSNQGPIEKALLGDLLALTAAEHGITGIVVDGLIRDLDALGAIGLPIFARGAIPAAAGKKGASEINGSIRCGGIQVNPGDLIVGDSDGVVVVPVSEIDSALKTAAAKEAAEIEIRQAIRQKKKLCLMGIY